MSKFSFRWGIELFDNSRTEIPNLILEHYHKIPVTNVEMMFIIHLASFRYETERGKSNPSLTKTLRERMGYKSNQGIINVEQALIDKGLLTIHKSQGRRSVYDFTAFSEKFLAFVPNPSTNIDDQNPSTKLDDFPNQSTKLDDHQSTKVDGSRQQKLTRIREEEKETEKENLDYSLSSLSCSEIWQQVEPILANQMTKATFMTIFPGTALTRDADHFTVTTPSPAALDWLEHRLAGPVETAVSAVAGEPAKVHFKLQEN